MAETIKIATKLVEQGHVRVGPQVVTDPAMLITRLGLEGRRGECSLCFSLTSPSPHPRTMEDFVTWVDSSKIKRHVVRYNDKLDDFDLMS